MLYELCSFVECIFTGSQQRLRQHRKKKKKKKTEVLSKLSVIHRLFLDVSSVLFAPQNRL